MRGIDSHLHLWDLSVSRYAWLGPQHGAIHRSFLPEEAGEELRLASVESAVLVQAEDSERDTVFMLDVADRFDWVAGVVGWVALDNPDLARRQLDRWQRHPRFAGVRHLVHDDPRADFLDLPDVRRSLAVLADRDVPFDVPDAWPAHLRQVEALAAALPDLTIVLDHLAKPPRGEAGFRDWRRTLEAVAAKPNTVAKVSGLYHQGQPHTADALEDVWRVALDAFGPARLMWGSDWPIAVLHGGYAEVTGALFELIDGLPAGDREWVLRGTARRVYGLA